MTLSLSPWPNQWSWPIQPTLFLTFYSIAEVIPWDKDQMWCQTVLLELQVLMPIRPSKTTTCANRKSLSIFLERPFLLTSFREAFLMKKTQLKLSKNNVEKSLKIEKNYKKIKINNYVTIKCLKRIKIRHTYLEIYWSLEFLLNIA